LSQDINNIKRMRDGGASAIVFHSLFEEQLQPQSRLVSKETATNGDSLQSVGSSEFKVGAEEYLDNIAKAKEAVDIPIIASLNGSSFGGWQRYARQLEQAGADAIELNLYSVPVDPDRTAEEIETEYLTIVASVRSLVKIPVAVKISPFFTNLTRFARRLDENGANALVLFNRFYQPDIELETLEVSPNVLLSTPMAMRLPMRWIALLYGRVGANLAATSGIHRATDALKMIMAGADVTMLCSVLLRRGINHIRVIEREMLEWLEEHEYNSIEQIKGLMSQQNCREPATFERAQYTRALATYRLNEPLPGAS
jgi:dihydroorotate dehydrogenase (fumarate)